MRPKKKLRSYLETISGVDYALFDVFDTIITRTVHPDHVKRLASKRLALLAGISLSPDELYSIRCQVEQSLRKKNEFAGHDPEFGFKELLEAFYNELKSHHGRLLKVSAKKFASICSDAEIHTEISVQRVDPDCVAAIRRLREMGVPVSCVSDFYLHEGMMRLFFRHHGIEDLFEHVFVSCDYLRAKWTGRLFARVFDKINIPPERVLMVGDSQYADINPARNIGMQCYLLDRKKQRAEYAAFMKNFSDVKKAARRINSEYMRAEKSLGRVYFGETAFPFYLFIRKLHARLMDKGVKNVFFLSKEGQFLLKLFNLYQDMNAFNGDARIKGHYLIASRRATFIPSLGPLSDERFENLFRQYTEVSPEEFMKSLNFNEEEYKPILYALSIDGAHRLEIFQKSDAFRRILKDGGFRSVYEIKRNEQKKNFKKYVASFSVNLTKEGLHLVDVGWKGTIQDNIYNIFEGGIRVNGYYLGLVEPGGKKSGNEKEGVLFSIFPKKSDYYRIYNENKQIFEMALGASHGSALSYESSGGRAYAITEEIDYEARLFIDLVKPLQDALEKRFISLDNLFKKTHLPNEQFDEFFAKKYSRLMFFPSRREMDYFRKFSHFQNFGFFTLSTYNLDRNIGFAARLKNLFRLVMNPYWEMTKGPWGPLTLSNMGLPGLRYLYGGFRYSQMYLNINK